MILLQRQVAWHDTTQFSKEAQSDGFKQASQASYIAKAYQDSEKFRIRIVLLIHVLRCGQLYCVKL